MDRTGTQTQGPHREHREYLQGQGCCFAGWYPAAILHHAKERAWTTIRKRLPKIHFNMDRITFAAEKRMVEYESKHNVPRMDVSFLEY